MFHITGTQWCSKSLWDTFEALRKASKENPEKLMYVIFEGKSLFAGHNGEVIFMQDFCEFIESKMDKF